MPVGNLGDGFLSTSSGIYGAKSGLKAKKTSRGHYRPSITRAGDVAGGSIDYSHLADLNAALRNSFSIQDESSYKMDMNHFRHGGPAMSPESRQRDFSSRFDAAHRNDHGDMEEVDTSKYDWLQLYAPETAKGGSRGGSGRKAKTKTTHKRNSDRKRNRKVSSARAAGKKSGEKASSGQAHQWTAVHAPVEDAADLNLGFQISKSRVQGKGIAKKAKRGKPQRGKDIAQSSNFSFDDFNLLPSDETNER